MAPTQNISEMSQEFTEIEIDKSIGGASQGQASKKSNRSGGVKGKRKTIGAGVGSGIEGV